MNADTPLGVKGSPVQIRPSRLVAGLFRMYLCLAESQQKSLTPQEWSLKSLRRSWATVSYQGICQYGRAREVGWSRGQRSLSPRSRCTPLWILAGTGRADHSGLFKVWRLDLVVRSGGIWGRSGLILLSVQAGRLRTHRKVLLLAAGRWGPLAYLAGWSRWVSAVWRRPAPGVRTAWARARRDPARMMSFLARVTPV